MRRLGETGLIVPDRRGRRPGSARGGVLSAAVALRWITLAVAVALIVPAAVAVLLPARRRRAGAEAGVVPPWRERGRLDLLWSALPAAFLVALIALAARAAG